MKMNQCLKCSSFFPITVIINRVKRNLQRRKYCLSCSPFKSHNTTKLEFSHIVVSTKRCPRCQETKSVKDFYCRRNGLGTSPYCKLCTNKETVVRQRALKTKSVKYLGNKCTDCNRAGHPAIFDFHHTDPSQKDFTIAKRSCASFDTIRPELDKCVLLCSCCHRLRHTNW